MLTADAFICWISCICTTCLLSDVRWLNIVGLPGMSPATIFGIGKGITNFGQSAYVTKLILKHGVRFTSAIWFRSTILIPNPKPIPITLSLILPDINSEPNNFSFNSLLNFRSPIWTYNYPILLLFYYKLHLLNFLGVEQKCRNLSSCPHWPWLHFHLKFSNSWNSVLHS